MFALLDLETGNCYQMLYDKVNAESARDFMEENGVSVGVFKVNSLQDLKIEMTRITNFTILKIGDP